MRVSLTTFVVAGVLMVMLVPSGCDRTVTPGKPNAASTTQASGTSASPAPAAEEPCAPAVQTAAAPARPILKAPAPVWTAPLAVEPGERISTPVVDGQTVIVGLDRFVQAFSLADGHLLWQAPRKLQMAWEVAAADGYVLYADGYDLVARQTATGAAPWTCWRPHSRRAPPIWFGMVTGFTPTRIRPSSGWI